MFENIMIFSNPDCNNVGLVRLMAGLPEVEKV